MHKLLALTLIGAAHAGGLRQHQYRGTPHSPGTGHIIIPGDSGKASKRIDKFLADPSVRKHCVRHDTREVGDIMTKPWVRKIGVQC